MVHHHPIEVLVTSMMHHGGFMDVNVGAKVDTEIDAIDNIISFEESSLFGWKRKLFP